MAEPILAVEARLKDFISVNLKDINSNIKRFGETSKKSFNKADKAASGFLATMGGFISAQAIIGSARQAFRLLSRTVSESITLFGQQAQAEAQLSTALGFTSQKLLDQASALQAVTTFGDEATIQAGALIAAFTKSEDQIARIIPLVQDLAAAKFKGQLAPAADLVSKTLGSTTNALSRYGIVVEGALGSNERLQSLITNLGKAFKGQAKAVAESGIGPLIQLQNILGDLKEQIGAAIVPILNTLAKNFIENRAVVSAMIDRFAAFVNQIKGPLLAGIITVSNTIVGLARSFIPATASFNAGAAASEFLRKSFVLISKAIVIAATTVRILFNAFQVLGNFMVTVFVQAITAVKFGFDSMVVSAKLLGNIIKAVFTGNFKAIPDIISAGLSESNDAFQEFISVSGQAWGDFADNTIANGEDIINAVTAAVESLGTVGETFNENLKKFDFEIFIQNLKNALGKIPGDTEDTTNKVVKDIKDLKKQFESVGAQLGSGLGKELANGIKGEEVDIKKVILGVLGRAAQLAITFFTGGIGGAVLGGLAGGTIGGLKHGTQFAQGGRTLVGERGPELVNIPRGSQVTPAERTRSVVNNTNNTSNPTVIVVNTSDVDFVQQIEAVVRDRSLNVPRLLQMGGVNV